MASRVKYTPTEAGSLALGQAGSKIVTSGSAVSPDSGVFIAFTVIDPAKISDLKPEDSLFPTHTDIGTGTELAIGLTIYGRWTEVTLSQGILIGYFG